MSHDQLQAECEGAGLPAGSRLCAICMGRVFGPEETDGHRAIWGLPPLHGTARDVRLVPVTPGDPKRRQPKPKPAAKTPPKGRRRKKPRERKQGCGTCGNHRSLRTRPATKVEPRTNGYGPGSQLLRLWHDMPHCDACQALAVKMDEWGPADCRQRLGTIVADILPRAREWMTDHKPFAHRILSATSTEDAVLGLAISQQVKRAIGIAEDLDRPVPESTTLAAIVPFYNYMRAASRIRNYHKCVAYFRDRGFAVYVAEAVLDGQEFQIPQDGRVRRFTVRDPLFIKESLVNIVLRDLPAHYTHVVWPDADFIFDRPDIVDATIEALDRYPVVQTFRTLEWLDAHGQPERGRQRNYAGAGFRAVQNKTRAFGRWPGGAWAARREVLDEIGGLYDGYPAGSCDVLALGGFLGTKGNRYFRRYSAATVQHYSAWRDQAYSVVRGKIGYVDAVASHLFHGVLKNRQYSQRHTKLKAANFDPVRHLERNADGVNQLSAACPKEIRDWLSAYMLKSRKEP